MELANQKSWDTGNGEAAGLPKSVVIPSATLSPINLLYLALSKKFS